MRLFQIDAFTDTPFRGNPAAVCLLDREHDTNWMQRVATEMNLSETAFLVRGKNSWWLRWFTPAVEVDLCGHATLASAHALWEDEIVARDETLRFHTHSGILTANRRRDGWIELDFPVKRAQRAGPPTGLLEGLGIAEARFVGKNQFDYLVEVDSAEVVRALNPDHALLRNLPVRGVMVTSRGNNGYDFVSRFFAPGSGIDEDPVTGSAHCCLAPYWAEILGKTKFKAYQASPRGGVLEVRLEGERVVLAGKAVTVFRGNLVV